MEYLSLDVEGAELYIMKHFPFDQYRFRVMTVERPNQELVDLLYQHGYRYMGANNEWGMETLFIHQLELQQLQLSEIQEVGWRNNSMKYMEVHPDGSLQHPPKVIWKD